MGILTYTEQKSNLILMDMSLLLDIKGKVSYYRVFDGKSTKLCEPEYIIDEVKFCIFDISRAVLLIGRTL